MNGRCFQQNVLKADLDLVEYTSPAIGSGIVTQQPKKRDSENNNHYTLLFTAISLSIGQTIILFKTSKLHCIFNFVETATHQQGTSDT